MWPHCGVLTVRVKGWFGSRFAPGVGLWPVRFPCVGPQKTRLGRSKFACRLRETTGRSLVGVFSLRTATKHASREVKTCISPARNHGADLGRSVFRVHAKLMSDLLAFAEVSGQSAPQECQGRVSHKSKGGQVRVSYQSVT